MRLEIFHWIEERILPFGTRGFVNYTERIVDKLRDKDKKLYVITEVMFAVGVTHAPASFLDVKTQAAWKAELEGIADSECDGCRLRFEADSSERNVSPDAVDIAKGTDPKALVPKRSFQLTANIHLRKPFKED